MYEQQQLHVELEVMRQRQVRYVCCLVEIYIFLFFSLYLHVELEAMRQRQVRYVCCLVEIPRGTSILAVIGSIRA